MASRFTRVHHFNASKESLSKDKCMVVEEKQLYLRVGVETKKHAWVFNDYPSDGTGPVLRILSYTLGQHYANLESFWSERFNWLSARTTSFKCYTNAVDMNYIIPVSFLLLSLPTQHHSSLFRKFWIKLTLSFTEISRLFSCATFTKLFLALRWTENLLAYLYAGSTMIVIRYKLLHYNKNKRIVNSNNKN